MRKWRRWMVGVALLGMPAAARATPYLLATVTSLGQVRRFDMSGTLVGSFPVSGTVRHLALGGFSAVCPADALADGTQCDDGDPCSTRDACVGGTCAGQVPAPGSVCRAARRATLAIDRPAKASKRKLSWRWRGDAAVARADFGDPSAGTALGFCLLSGVAPVARFVVPPGAYWKAQRKRVVYRDPAGSAAGVKRIGLEPGAAGKAQIAVEAGGTGLDVVLPLTAPVTARLQRLDGGTCWESPLTVTRNDARRVRARSP